MGQELTKPTEQQQAFLDALKDPEIVTVPAKQRLRWAATKAGYSEKTTIADITKPLHKQIVDVAERILMNASVDAAWALVDAVNGDNVEVVKTRFRLQAAQEILDRAVPKKVEQKANQAPLVQIMLPAKAAKVIQIEDDTVSSDT